jgi:hypothetical protein
VRSLLVALAFAAATILSWSSASEVTASPPSLDILVVAGQSNALGYQSYVVDPTTHKNVFTETHSAADKKVLLMWNESGVPTSGANPVPLDTPQALAGAPSPVFGPEVGLARTLYAAGHRHLLIVKVAFSGSSLAVNWQLGSPDFQALVTSVQNAESWATSHGWRPSIGAFYWMQGETDAMSSSWASSYRSNLTTFFTTVRKQLDFDKTTPIVVGEIDLHDYIAFETLHDCSSPTCAPQMRWNAEVMAAQRAVAAKDVFVVSTSRLSRYDDFLHLTDAAELALGLAFGLLSEHHLT